ncbi:Exostosin-like 3 [Trichoplax sp. H2]|nr:Exostosin-like 3 [Trichoplax sp. H2]|eukprot:RDD47513.1 Exostosin-like 3 [Trichoplax sp. H2]
MTRSGYSGSLLTYRVGKTCAHSFKRGRVFYLLVLIALLSISLIISLYRNNNCTPCQHHFQADKCQQNIDCCLRLEARVKRLRSIKVAIQNEIKVLSSTRFQLDRDVAELKLLKLARPNTNNVNGRDKRCQCKKDGDVLKKTIQHQRSQISLLNELLTNLDRPSYNNKLQLSPCKPIKIDLTWKSDATKVLRDCNLQRCFHYDRCPLTKIFNAYIYPSRYHVNSVLANQSFQSIPFLTRNATAACVYVVIVNSTAATRRDLEGYLHSLPYWHRYGRNHLLVDIGWTIQKLLSINTGYAMLAGSNFANFVPRMNFDIIIPPMQLFPQYHGKLIDSGPRRPFTISKQRQYLLHFRGQIIANNSINLLLRSQLSNISNIAKVMGNKVDIQTQCKKVNKLYYHKFEWSLCSGNVDKQLRESTFSLIILHNGPCISTLTRLMHALASGTIPIFITDHSIKMTLVQMLPFAEYIDWNLAGIMLPLTRLPEMTAVLMAISNSDILKKRSHCQFIYHTYFSNSENVLHATLALLRTRLHLPAYPVDTFIQDQFSNSKYSLNNVINIDKSMPSIPSTSYTRNYSTNFYNAWNKAPGPYWLYPFTADNSFLPTDSQFNGFGKGFQPINNGGTATGKMFSKHLGGNYPLEQFTIIILTHNRPNILRQRLINLSRLLYLNKIIVVWNEYNKYAKHFQWPHSDIPIYVFKSKRNSLNDRFFPFNAVETEAVLSLDDDVDLNADEIDFAFRRVFAISNKLFLFESVWRESRDRIVGFPARHHTWNKLTNRWSYDSNKTCQLSMVLTGAAFIHKYYLFLYTFTMPEGIRRRVDEIMNCEDIAMNFLISHITGKPPIKVTSRWNFNCPTCETTLTRDVNHFKKRNSCVNYFAQIYGYMPLIFSQFRVDSILYRTRVPNGEQKCYESQL